MLLDTSGLLALYDARAAFHGLAVERFRGAPRRITHNYVLVELVALVAARNLPRENALRYVAGLMEEHGISEALTTDHHFEQEGFVRLLK